MDHVVPGAALHDLAAVHNDDTVRHLRDHRQVVGNENEGGVLLLHQLVHELEDLGLDGHVQGSGGLVGDDEFGVGRQGDGDDDPLTHTAGKLVGIRLEPVLRVGDAHHMQQLHTARVFFLLGHLLLVEIQHLGDLFFNRIERIQGGHGVLEYHGDLLAPDLHHFLFALFADVLAPEEDLVRLHHAGRLDQFEDGKAADGFAAARLAHDTQHLPLIQGKADAVHRLDHAPEGVEIGPQIFHLQQCFAHLSPPPYFSFGLNSSRRKSPKRLIPNTISMM